MERREFLAASAAPIAGLRFRIADFPPPPPKPQSANPHPQSPQEPPPSPGVFSPPPPPAPPELRARKIDLLTATPGTNYESLTGYNPGRSERLIALLLPARGDPTIVCPSFEVARIRQHSVVAATRGWEEQDDPYRLVRQAVREMKLSARAVALESTTAYAVALRLAEAPGGEIADAPPLTHPLRLIQTPPEDAPLRP